MIYFDLETRQFSTTLAKQNWKEIMPTVAGGAGGALVGGTIGAIHSKRNAKKLADAKGLKPGTPEYKAFMKGKGLKGGLVGGVTGGALGAVGGYGLNKINTQKKSINSKDKELHKLSYENEDLNRANDKMKTQNKNLNSELDNTQNTLRNVREKYRFEEKQNNEFYDKIRDLEYDKKHNIK